MGLAKRRVTVMLILAAAVVMVGVPCGLDVDRNPGWPPINDWDVSPAEIFLDSDTYMVFQCKPQ